MTKDDSYWLKVACLVFVVLVCFVSYKAFGTLGLQTGWDKRYDQVFPIVSTIGSGLIALLALYGLAKKQERREYFLASIAELRRVSWPSFVDTRRMTLVVCVVVGIFAVILAIFDLVWAKILGLLIS